MQTNTNTQQNAQAREAHTPGPWETAQAIGMGGCAEPAIHIRTQDGVILATAKAGRRFADPIHLDANARLMAAAPCLAEALRAILALAREMKRSHVANVIACKAQDALAKL